MALFRWTFRIVLAAAMAVGLGYLPYHTHGPEGRANRLAAEYERLVETNLELQRDNRALARQIRGLKDDLSAIERVARDELGLVRPGDIVFQFVGAPRRGEGGAP